MSTNAPLLMSAVSAPPGKPLGFQLVVVNQSPSPAFQVTVAACREPRAERNEARTTARESAVRRGRAEWVCFIPLYQNRSKSGVSRNHNLQRREECDGGCFVRGINTLWIVISNS